MRRWLALLLVVTTVFGCQTRTTSDEEGSRGPAAPDYCPAGSGDWVAGQVLRPEWRPTAGKAAPDAASTDTDAPAVERRATPAPKVPVRLYRHQQEETLARGETDAKGRWCLRVDGTFDFGVDLLAEATLDDVRLRRPVITRSGQVISLRTEALVRLMVEREVGLATVPRAVYLNMEAMAATAVDLIDPVAWRADETLATGVDRAVDRLAADDRLAKKLQRLGDNGAEP